MFPILSINLKFNIVIFSTLTILGLIIYTNYNTYKELQNVTFSRLLASEVATQLQVLRRNEQNFVITKNTAYASRFEKEYSELLKKTKQLKFRLKNTDFNEAKIDKLDFYIKNYKKAFLDVVEIKKKIGLSSRHGALRELFLVKEKIKVKLQELNGYQPIREEFLLLQIYEQDFITYKELKYAHFFDEKYEMSLDKVKQMALYEQTRKDLNDLFVDYKKAFDGLVKLIGDFGIKETSGLRGTSRNMVNGVADYMHKTTVQIYSTVAEHENSVKKQGMIISIVLALLLIIINFSLLNRVKNKLKLLLLSSKKLQVESNDFRNRIDIYSRDEIGEIAKFLNKFISDSQLKIKHCQRNFTKTLESLDEIEKISAKMERNIGLEEKYLKEITNEIHASRLLTEKSVFFARDIEESLENKSKNIKDSQNIATRFNNEIEDSFQITLDLALKMGVLKDESTNLNLISEKVDDIADRLNLVSMNAAIEASKAGEHGKGFSIVADRIRLLSEETTQILENVDENVKIVNQVISELDEQIIKNNNFISRIKDSTNYIKENLDAVETDFSSVYKNAQELYNKNDQSGEKIGNIVAKVGDLNGSISSYRVMSVSLFGELKKISATQEETKETVLSFQT